MASKKFLKKSIPVIDLFAGPGGLSEGFASFAPQADMDSPFNVCASVEMDAWAHQTLELRSFFHEFKRGHAPDEYYQLLKQEITKDELFELYPVQAAVAKKQAILAELGKEDDDKVIRQKLDQVLKEQPGKQWVLIGGPPCQAFSVIGRSRRQANGAGHQIQEDDHRNFLYLRYLDIIARYKPAVFVMENVKGMLSAQVKGERIFYKIMEDLRHPKVALADSEVPGYKHNGLEYKIYSLVISKEDGKPLDPTDYIIKSENFGVGQARHRVILLGVRSDIDVKPRTLTPRKDKVNVESLIADLPKLRSTFTRPVASAEEWYDFLLEIRNQDWYKRYQPAVESDGPIDDALAELLKSKMDEYLGQLSAGATTGSEFIEGSVKTEYRPDWFNDPRLEGTVNHIARGHMKEDLYRYFFAAAYTSVFGYSPRMKDFPRQLLPKHKNVAQSLKEGAFDDRFRVQQTDRPATTITCHISKDGHYNIHYDPSQCRSLTVREAARLQSFPDNYYFVGPRTQQYHQVGNAVPPLLATQIADIVYEVLDKVLKQADQKQSNEIKSATPITLSSMEPAGVAV
jgi:DNA (cytosine-5)-methyltransferase 1